MASWGTLSINIPDLVEDIQENVSDVATAAIAALDIALAALQLVKAYSFSYLDPTAAIVQQVVDRLTALLEDLRQYGVYLTGDWNLLGDSTLDDVKGGFAEYERRMIARLTDRTDPTRPDISTDTDTLGAFFYLSVDASEIQRMLDFLKLMGQLLNQSFFPAGSPPASVVTQVQYGAQGIWDSLTNITRKSETPPNKVKLNWKVVPTSTRHPFNPIPPFPPGGFLVTVSTLPDPIPLNYSRPLNDSSKSENAEGEPQQKREYGFCEDVNGQPIMLYGGADMLANLEGVLYNATIEDGKVKDGTTQVYGLLDDAQNGVIPLENLRVGSTYYYQRTFRVPLSKVAVDWATEEYTLILDKEDMPHHARPEVLSDGKIELVDEGLADVYYVNVFSATRQLGSGDQNYQWDFSTGQDTGNTAGLPFKVGLTDSLTPAAIAVPSPTTQIVFPTDSTSEFTDAVTAALAVMVLSRIDLPIADEAAQQKGAIWEQEVNEGLLNPVGIALGRTGLEKFHPLMQKMYPEGIEKALASRGTDPRQFRQDLLERARNTAKLILDNLGNQEDVLRLVVENTESLRTTTWDTILEGIGETRAAQTIRDRLGAQKMTLLSSLDSEPEDPSEEDAIKALLKQMNLEGSTVVDTSTLRIPTLKPGSLQAFGVAPNPYSMYLAETKIDNLLRNPQVTRHRTPMFVEFREELEDPIVAVRIESEDVERVLSEVSPGLRVVYRSYIDASGDIVLPADVADALNELQTYSRVRGSYDMAPVLYVGATTLTNVRDFGAKERLTEATFLPGGEGILYIRSLWALYDEGVIYREATTALSVAAAALQRSPLDGEWKSLRLGDILPDFSNFMETLDSWMSSVSVSTESTADSLLKYIEFMESRVTELQQLIRRIDSILATLGSFVLKIPSCSALVTVAGGTTGVLNNLVTADSKPDDSPLAYGGGLAFLAAPVPQLLLDFILVEEGEPGDGTISVSGSGGFSLSTPTPQAPSDIPDVL